MATSRNISSYGLEYFDALHAAYAKGTLPVKCETPQAAKDARLRFYGFKRALLESPQHDPELAAILDVFHFLVKGDVLTITYGDRTARALRHAIGDTQHDDRQQQFPFDASLPSTEGSDAGN